MISMAKEKTFEEKFSSIRDIVAKLERGNTNLQDSIDQFKEGTKLIKECQDYLEKTELEIKKVIDETGATEDLEEPE